MFHSLKDMYLDEKVTKSKKNLKIFFLNKIFLEIMRQYIEIISPITKTSGRYSNFNFYILIVTSFSNLIPIEKNKIQQYVIAIVAKSSFNNEGEGLKELLQTYLTVLLTVFKHNMHLLVS